MKILLLGYGEGGGIGTYSQELANNLSKDSEIELVTVGDRKVYEKSKLNCNFVDMPSTKIPHFSLFRMLQVKKIEKIINKLNVDLVHSVSSPLVSFINLKKPIITTAWFYPPSILGSIKVLWNYQSKLKFLPTAYIRFVASYEDLRGYKKSQKILAVTKKLAEALREKKYPAIYMPPCISPKENISKKFDIITLIFASLDPTHKRKGLKFLLRALDYMIKNKLTNNKFQLIIIGKRTEKLLKYAKKYSFITVLGALEREKTLEIISKSHILIAPSIYEEFGYNVLEGMACGLPIVASNIHSFQDMVEDGKNGYLVNITDTKKFAQRLSFLINDNEKMKFFGKKSLEIIKDNFSPTKLIPQLKKEYFKLIYI